MTLLIHLYWHLHPVWKRGLKVFEGSSPVYLTRIWTCSLGINFTAAIKPNPHPPPALFPYSFLHPCPVSGGDAGDGGPCRSPDKPEPVKQEPVRAIFTAGAPGASLSFSVLSVSHLSLSLLLISETSMTSILMHLRELHVHCFCMTLFNIHIHESVHVHAAIISYMGLSLTFFSFRWTSYSAPQLSW